MPSSLFGPLLARAKARGSNVKGKGGRGWLSNATAGRAGATGPTAMNATSSVFQFTDTVSGSTSKTYVLSCDADVVRVSFNLSTTATGNSTTADILMGISQIIILAPDGPIITLQPMPDFYYFQQRFGPMHQLPSAVTVTGATAGVGTYTLYGVNLPKARGPYTMIISIPAPASFNTSTTALSVNYTVALGIGDCQGVRTRFAYSGLPFTPGASGINDLAPVAPIQDADLVEIWMSGFTAASATSTSNDLSYAQIISQGGVVGPRVTSQDLIATANAEMVSALFSAAQSGISSGSTGYTPSLFLLFPLKTTVKLGRQAHVYLNWGSSPASTIRTGFVWFD